MSWLSDAFSSVASAGKSAVSDVGNFFGVGDISRIAGFNSPLPNAGGNFGMFGLPTKYSTPMMEMAGLAGGAYLGAGAMGFGPGAAGAGGAAGTAAGMTEEEQLMASLNQMTDPAAGGGFLSNVFGGGGGAATGAGAGGGGISNALILGSGLYGMNMASQMQKMAMAAQGQADPFGSQRGMYQQQLAALQADPSSVTRLPGYQTAFGQGNIALQRMQAAGGGLGGGGAEIAAQRYGQEFAGQYLSAEEARLAQLAGASIAPNPYGAISGYGAGAQLASQSLATLGYGAGRMGY